MEHYLSILSDCFHTNRDITPSNLALVAFFPASREKYVGCVHCKLDSEMCVCINNSAERTCIYYPESRKVKFSNSLSGLSFSYTSGGYDSKSNCIYGFPRNSNKLLRIRLDTLMIDEIAILPETDRKQSIFGDYYGGRIVDGYIYCPPRLGKDLLLIDLEAFKVYKVYHEIFSSNNYNGAILHPNGSLYFTPMQGSRLAEFSPGTHKLRLIGDKLSSSLFGGSVYKDGNIYMYGTTGLYMFDLKNDTVSLLFNETLEKNKIYGSYGTITHFNGKIYNVPGDTPYIYEFDPNNMSCITALTFKDGHFNKAKWAGGALLENGNIFLVPAFGRFAAEITFDSKPMLSENMKKLTYSAMFNPL